MATVIYEIYREHETGERELLATTTRKRVDPVPEVGEPVTFKGEPHHNPHAKQGDAPRPDPVLIVEEITRIEGKDSFAARFTVSRQHEGPGEEHHFLFERNLRRILRGTGWDLKAKPRPLGPGVVTEVDLDSRYDIEDLEGLEGY